MTKEAVLAKLSASTIIHIASYGCWDDGVFVCSPNPSTNHGEDGATPQNRYLITSNDVSQLKLIADLVVLNFGYGNKHRELQRRTPAFLVAGAKSVLLPQWAICEAAQDKFWYHFYDSLHADGIHVTEALRKAKLSVREDKRFRHPRYWAGYCLLGNDPKVDLKQIKTAVLDKHLTQMEQTVLKNLPKDVLNEPPKSDQEHSHDALIRQLCLHLSDLLLDHRDDDVIPGLVSLMNGYRELARSRDSKPPVQKISTSITSSTPAVKLLSLVGFHFQAGGIDPTEPPVALYPQWDPDRLMDLTIQALQGIATVSYQADCSYALSKVLLESSAVHSDVIDLLAITKHMPEIQLKSADHGVAAVWGGNVNRELLLKLGFAEVGTLLMFEGNSHNKKLLSAVLQVLCAVCGDKGVSMLERLDPQFLGVANRRVLSKSPSQSPVKSARLKHSSALRSPAVQQPPPPPKRLPSLNPVLISDSKMAFSTSWQIIPENEAEVKEKMEVSRSLTTVRTDGQVNARVTNEWHALCSYPQALQALNSLGQPTVKRTKVKVHPGGSPSSQRVPLGYKPPLTLEAIEQRRDYAHYVLQERHRDVARRQEKAVRNVFLPYVNNRKVP
ncbi:putative tetratricopeptide repeat protein 28 [Apostichopus japonicus]|uniref:Putative tetratricopeptide repeat protein 28 n=1 Tax=Stichopus japonicus TaxID=307972 RepID=A0A2G8K0H0_STIJA|nr:putative tetratricopeptide repeat protein 28 [Apostichopus japonicus]